MRIAALILVMLVAACGPPSSTGAPERTSVVVMDEIEAGMPLDSMLALLEQQLTTALEGRLEGGAVDEFRIAEAITDRLLEARMPFEWLNAEDYHLESRLRQVQSGADRVLAQVQMNVARDTMLAELKLLHDEVVELRRSIADGGRRAPPSIHALLGDTTDRGRESAREGQAAPAPAPTRRSGPIGTPLPPPDSI